MKQNGLINQIGYKTSLYLKRNSSSILTCIGAAGVVITSVLTAKATLKAEKLLKEAKCEKGEELTKSETIKIAGPVYITSTTMGVATIACIFGANVLNKKKQAALMSAYALVDSAYKEYQVKATELFGNGADKQIKNAVIDDRVSKQNIQKISNNKTLFYDEISDRFFESTIEDVQYAEYHFNRNFALRSYANLNEFYDFLEIDRTDYGDEIGWDMGAGEIFYGYSWVDFDHIKRTLKDGTEYYIISTPFGPHPLDDDFYGALEM